MRLEGDPEPARELRVPVVSLIVLVATALLLLGGLIGFWLALLTGHQAV